MDAPQLDTLTITLPKMLIERLKKEAEAQQRPLDTVVEDVIEAYLTEDEDWEEDSDEQILADLRESLQQAKRGEWLDFDEVMAEMKRKYDVDHH